MANATDHELHVGTVATGYPAYDVSDPMVVDQVRDRAQEMLEEQAKRIEEAGERSLRSTLGYRSTAEPRSSSRAPRR